MIRDRARVRLAIQVLTAPLNDTFPPEVAPMELVDLAFVMTKTNMFSYLSKRSS